MAEYITIDQAVEAVTKTQGLRGDALRALHELPTIDIVTCKECKHRHKGNYYAYRCDLADNPFGDSRDCCVDDWFCADGERR